MLILYSSLCPHLPTDWGRWLPSLNLILKKYYYWCKCAFFFLPTVVKYRLMADVWIIGVLSLIKQTQTNPCKYTARKPQAEANTSALICTVTCAHINRHSYAVIIKRKKILLRDFYERSKVEQGCLKRGRRTMGVSVECGRLDRRANIMRRFSSQYYQSALEQWHITPVSI